MDQTPQNPVTPPAPQAAPQSTPAVSAAPASTPVPPKKELTPEEKKALRKEKLKRMGMVFGIGYAALLLLITFWAFFMAGSDLSFFKLIGSKQKYFDAALMTVAHVQLLLAVMVTLLISLWFLFKNVMAKKEDVEKKKMASKKAMIFGGSFFGATIVWLLMVLFVSPKLVPPEAAAIVTDPSNTIGLTAPVEIEFDASGVPIDTDIYRILSYTWNFGDGDTATGVRTTHRYTEKGSLNGRYTVVLTVDYQDLSSGETFDGEFLVEVSITNEQVAASFTATPEDGEIPLEVKFDASASNDPDGEIVSYEWDLNGDGRFDDAEGVTAEYTYEQEGSYEVSLRVTDNNGEYNIATTTIEAGTVNGLRAIITSDVGSDGLYYIDEKYTFTGELSLIDDGSISKYTWDFGDGSKKVQSRSTSHTFEEPGKYEVTLTITDQNGNTDESVTEINVVDQGTAPAAKVSTDPALNGDTVRGPLPLEVTFDAASSTDPDDDIVDYQWDFDSDGEIDDTGSSVTYSYDEEGTYEATLSVIDAGGNISEKVINVVVTEQGIVADLQVDETNGETPLTVNFDASGSSYKEGAIASYSYDFGDGSDPYVGGSEVTYKYTSTGTFTATLTVTGTDGKTDTTTVVIVVRPVAITACFTVNTESGTSPLYVAVDPSCSKGAISNYSWDFGDGDISFDRKPETHTYSTRGTYTITLEVTSGSGVVDVFTKEITVN